MGLVILAAAFAVFLLVIIVGTAIEEYKKRGDRQTAIFWSVIVVGIFLMIMGPTLATIDYYRTPPDSDGTLLLQVGMAVGLGGLVLHVLPVLVDDVTRDAQMDVKWLTIFICVLTVTLVGWTLDVSNSLPAALDLIENIGVSLGLVACGWILFQKLPIKKVEVA